MPRRSLYLGPVVLTVSIALILLLRTFTPPTGQLASHWSPAEDQVTEAPDTTLEPNLSYLPIAMRALHQTSVPQPTEAPVTPDPRGCQPPRRLCPPGFGTNTPVPGEGTPTVCPTCRRR